MLLNGIVNLAISRSLVLFPYFFQAFQKRGIDVNRKTVCLHTSSMPLLYMYVNRLRYPGAPAPQKERPFYPHAWKAGVLRAGLIILTLQ
jgi:hypothetical protein